MTLTSKQQDMSRWSYFKQILFLLTTSELKQSKDYYRGVLLSIIKANKFNG